MRKVCIQWTSLGGYPDCGQLCGQQVAVRVSRSSYFNMQSHAVIAAILIPLDIKSAFDCVVLFSVLHEFYSPACRNCKEVKTLLQGCWDGGGGIISGIGDLYHSKLYLAAYSLMK